MGLLLRALWWRRGLSLATLLVAAITIGAGSLGPLYARAADESTLRDTLSANIGPATLRYDFQRNVQGPDDLSAVAELGPKPGSILGYPTSLTGVEIKTGVTLPMAASVGSPFYLSQLVWRQDQCQHLVLTSGHCATAAGQVMVSERTRQTYPGWTIGHKVSLNDIQVAGFDGNGSSALLTIVGTYRADDQTNAYWYGHDFFDAHPGNVTSPDTLDSSW